MSFNAIAWLDVWEKVMYEFVVSNHPKWNLSEIVKLGGLCAGFRLHAERVVKRFLRYCVIFAASEYEDMIWRQCAKKSAIQTAAVAVPYMDAAHEAVKLPILDQFAQVAVRGRDAAYAALLGGLGR